jgi:hypothetical protein
MRQINNGVESRSTSYGLAVAVAAGVSSVLSIGVLIASVLVTSGALVAAAVGVSVGAGVLVGGGVLLGVAVGVSVGAVVLVGGGVLLGVAVGVWVGSGVAVGGFGVLLGTGVAVAGGTAVGGTGGSSGSSVGGTCVGTEVKVGALVGVARGVLVLGGNAVRVDVGRGVFPGSGTFHGGCDNPSAASLPDWETPTALDTTGEIEMGTVSPNLFSIGPCSERII